MICRKISLNDIISTCLERGVVSVGTKKAVNETEKAVKRQQSRKDAFAKQT